MKTFLFFYLLLTGFICALNYEGRISINGVEQKINLKDAGITGQGAFGYATWLKENQEQNLNFYLRGDTSAWQKISVSFIPDKDGKAVLHFISQFFSESGDTAKEKRYAVYDNITVEGSEIKNADFEIESGGKPAEWTYMIKNDEYPPFYGKNAKYAKSGKCAVACWHDGGINQWIPVSRGKKITIGFFFRCLDEKERDAWLREFGGKEKLAVYKDHSPDVYLDISKSCNMDFSDEIAGDGYGGWSDQGRENDFSGIEITNTEFGPVKFHLVNPDKNKKKAVMTFASKHIHEKVNLQKAVIAAGGAKARFLYILHSGCWVPRKETEIGTITVHTGNNSSYKIFSGRDLADWWNPASLPNALVALRKENKSSSVGMYVSKFKIADELTAVQEITIETSGEAIWIIAAATLSSQDLPITGAGKWSPAAGTQWKAVDLSDLIIKENSALDFSSQVEAGPAGKYGRAIVNQNGRMVFEKKTDQEIRFFSCGLIWRDLARLQNNDEAAKLAGLIRRQGYNMVRLHFLDSYLMLDAKDDFAFNPVNYDRFQYFFKALKDNGIYVYLDAMTSWSGYSKESAWSKAGKDLDFKRRIFIDEKTRQHWIKGVSGFLTDVNPYTKTALKDDTAVVCILFFNEVFHPHIVEGFTGEYLPVWQKFLQQKYGSVEKLRSIWIDDQGHELCSAASFSEIPMFEKKHFWDRSPICIDLGLFCEYLTTDMINFWTAEIRKMGYNGLVSVYDSIKNFSHCAVRNNIPAVSMHGYHAHPTGFTQKDSGISQSSSIPGGVRYFTSILGQRYLDRPFIVTEYNHAFWNKYRHETGLVSGSYASLHDIDGMLGFTSPAIFNADVPMNSFSAGHDPVMRGNEVIAGYLYRTRAVKPSPKIIQLYLDHEYIFEKGNAMRTVGTDQLLLALLARFGLYYEKGSPFSIKGPAADLVLRPAGTGKIEGGMGAVHIESSEADTNFLPAVIKTMKEKGIIPENNPTDSAAGIYASGTGEIMLSENSKGIKVITERAEGISLGIPKAVKLSVLEITALGQNSSATLLSLDLKPLSRSERMLLVFETDALNSESVYTSDYRDRLVENGKLPVLIKTGRISLTINNSRADVMRLFALSFNGERKEELPVKKNSGRLEAEIDTSRLKNGPAVFFEIAAE